MTSSTYDKTTQGAATLADGDVERVLGETYGITPVENLPLPGEIDRNFAIKDGTGRRFVLKIAGSGARKDELRFHSRLLGHLAEKQLGFAVPQSVPTVDGQPIGSVALGDRYHLVRLLTWVPGTIIGEIEHQRPELLAELGATAAAIVEALSDFSDPAADRTHHWDMRRAPESVRACLPYVTDENHRAAMERIVGWFESSVAPVMDSLPEAVCHQDLNDFNIVVDHGSDGRLHVSGVLDMSDALRSFRAAELGITVAYAMLRKADPLAAARNVVAGFHAHTPLSESEIAVIFPLAAVRLCMNAATWSRRKDEDDSNDYAYDRMRYTLPLIETLANIEPAFANAHLRWACGLDPVPNADTIVALLASEPHAPIVEGLADPVLVDLSPSAFVDIQPTTGIGRHGEARLGRAARRDEGIDEPATVHVGIDIFCSSGSAVHAPLGGIVEAVGDDFVLIRTSTWDVTSFWTSLHGISPRVSGNSVEPGDVVGSVVGSGDALGGRVHVQVSTVLPSPETPAPDHVRPSEREFWMRVCPDPAPLVGLRSSVPDGLNVKDVLGKRDEHFARSQRSYYTRPPNLVRARGTVFTDENGHQYLDAVNNVTHVGHGHPHVIEAAYRQMQRLNTNSRFVYEGLATYAERLASLLPAPLEVLFFVCTGSEANDLALRMARTATGHSDVLVLDGAYHGNTDAVQDISPNRFDGPGGTGPPATTTVLPQPNRYRGPYSYDDAEAGEHFAADARDVIKKMYAPPAAVFAESLMGTAGEIVLPDGYLSLLYEAVRDAGGLCVADEVQIGFGRLGANFWGFQDHGVIPDIVTMGKPIGNGHPLAAVATTRQIAEAFDNGMRYFNTFAGNPVSCAIGHAVLDVIENEGLQQHARSVGAYWLSRLTELKSHHEIIGDVRGRGLYVGVELVKNRETKEYATEAAFAISERMMQLGVITYPNGQHDNILKFKPPMVFTDEDADLVVDTMDRVLTEGW